VGARYNKIEKQLMEQRYFIAIVPHEKLCDEIVSIKQDISHVGGTVFY
jgi:hypothetical protein